MEKCDGTQYHRPMEYKLRRKIDAFLERWKQDPDRLPLIVKGARQIGKTSSIEHFAENYRCFVEINFITEPQYTKIFSSGYSPENVIKEISLINPALRFVPNETLILFDEMQACPDCATCLKFFKQDGRYDVICSGSLLGINYEEVTSVSVGFKEDYEMHSLDFEEFLWARGVSDEMIDDLRSKIKGCIPLDDVTYEMMMRHFRAFMISGGMPEVVRNIVAGENDKAIAAMDTILANTLEDINKYNDGVDVIKTRRCFESIPSQLRDTNKKFTFSRMVDKDNERLDNSTKQKYYGNTEWLGAAGYGNFCYMLTEPVLPLKANEIVDQYRIYLFDTGMLTHIYGPSARVATFTDDYRYNQGAVAENVVAECLMKSGIQPRCYRKTNGKNRMELDFVIELGLDLCVIEVKSGKDREFPSLRKASEVFRIDRRILLEKGNIHVDEDGVEHYPLFAAAFIREMIRGRDGFDENGLPVEGI